MDLKNMEMNDSFSYTFATAVFALGQNYTPEGFAWMQLLYFGTLYVVLLTLDDIMDWSVMQRRFGSK